MKTLLIYSAALLLNFSTFADETTTLHSSEVTPGVDQSLQNEARIAIERAQQWLIKNQNENGSWSLASWPALTGLPVWALSLDENRDEKIQAAIDRGSEYILTQVQDNGSIFNAKGGLRNYNTALCMTGLFMSGKPEVIPVVQKARKYLAQSQHKKPGPYYGGMGYDADLHRNYADMSNSYIAYEAMQLTKSVEELRASSEEKAELDWNAAVEFLIQNQNLDNEKPWMQDDGGFVYHPAYFDTKGRISNKGGTTTNEAGIIKFNSYGSMTYAGMLSFIYADVSPDDYRVRSAFKWALSNWTLEENPGVGSEGLYYFYNVLAKGLSTMGHDVLHLPDGRQVNWRDAFIRKVLNLQKLDDKGNGHWVNEAQRYSEGDKAMITAYTLIALQYALPQE